MGPKLWPLHLLPETEGGIEVSAKASEIRDLIIIGGGPAGLSAAVNASSEKIATLLLDGNERLGGQAGTSSNIENYAGFPCGVTGQDLADRMVKQALRFGTEMQAPVMASRIVRDEKTGLLCVSDDAGDRFLTRSVVLASGVRYRRLPVPNVVAYLGNGVSYGSPSLQDQYTDEEHYGEWYSYYGLEMLPASDYAGENLSLEYHEPARHPFDNLIRVGN